MKDCYIVLFDLRENNGHILALEDEHGNIARFSTYEEANDAAERNPLSDAFLVRIVDMDDDTEYRL
jgi:hypothetical protein